MGLSTGNSLSSGGGGSSGLSTSGVTTLIKNNTPWQYIETITASSSSTLELTNSNISNFDAFYIQFDNINLSDNAQTRMRLYLDNALKTDSSYRFTNVLGSNTSATTAGNSGLSSWIYGGQSYTWMRNITGAMYVNGKAGSIKVLKSDLGAGNSGNSAVRHSVGGQYNGSDSSTITGFNFFPNSGNYLSGQLHLYGMNKHD
jgi:hypothetical protein